VKSRGEPTTGAAQTNRPTNLPMIEWDDVLSRVATLERKNDQLFERLTLISSELDHTWEVYRQTQSELTLLKKDAATRRAISPYIKNRQPAAQARVAYARSVKERKMRNNGRSAAPARPFAARGKRWTSPARPLESRGFQNLQRKL
jgi:hypothetical protein